MNRALTEIFELNFLQRCVLLVNLVDKIGPFSHNLSIHGAASNDHKLLQIVAPIGHSCQHASVDLGQGRLVEGKLLQRGLLRHVFLHEGDQLREHIITALKWRARRTQLHFTDLSAVQSTSDGLSIKMFRCKVGNRLLLPIHLPFIKFDHAGETLFDGRATDFQVIKGDSMDSQLKYTLLEASYLVVYGI